MNNPRKPMAKKNSKFRKAAKFVMENVTPKVTHLGKPTSALSENYWIEKLDPKHREREYLWKNLTKWKEAKLNEEIDFFSWLDQKELKDLEEKNQPSSLEYHASSDSAKQYAVKFIHDQACDQTGKPIDTTNYKGKKPGYAAYVVNEAGDLFIAEHLKGKLQHSSFTAGKKIICAGMVKLKNGKIEEINNHSGHYKPTLSNLNFAMKSIPDEVFADDGKVTYSKVNESNFLQQGALSDKYLVRKIARTLQSPHKVLSANKAEFISYARRELDNAKKKPLTFRDEKGNRVVITLYESLLAQAITENSTVWGETVYKINISIVEMLDKLINAKAPKVEDELKKYLENIPEKIKGQGTVFEQIQRFLLGNIEAEGLAQSLIFHKLFCEDILPKVKLNDEDERKIESHYKELRSDQLFSKDARGRKTIRSQTYFPKKSDELGIVSPKYLPNAHKNYFTDKQGSHQPGKSYFTFKGDRRSISESLAAKHSEEKYDDTLSYAKQVEKYNIPFVAGPSGTVTVILPVLKRLMPELTDEEEHTYLMALAAMEVASGHHSFYEVMVVAGATYDSTFYTEQLLTPDFIKSQAYKDFRDKFNEEFDKISRLIIAENSDDPKDELTQYFHVAQKTINTSNREDELYMAVIDWVNAAITYQSHKTSKNSALNHVGRFFTKGIDADTGNAVRDFVTKLLCFIRDEQGSLKDVLAKLQTSGFSGDALSHNTVVSQLVTLIKMIEYKRESSSILQAKLKPYVETLNKKLNTTEESKDKNTTQKRLSLTNAIEAINHYGQSDDLNSLYTKVQAERDKLAKLGSSGGFFSTLRHAFGFQSKTHDELDEICELIKNHQAELAAYARLRSSMSSESKSQNEMSYDTDDDSQDLEELIQIKKEIVNFCSINLKYADAVDAAANSNTPADAQKLHINFSNPKERVLYNILCIPENKPDPLSEVGKQLATLQPSVNVQNIDQFINHIGTRILQKNQADDSADVQQTLKKNK